MNLEDRVKSLEFTSLPILDSLARIKALEDKVSLLDDMLRQAQNRCDALYGDFHACRRNLKAHGIYKYGVK